MAAKRALIAGGGIGGLSLAIALSKVGFEPVVLERATELREVGAGLTMWSNGVKALRRLGVAEPVLAAASRLERFEVRSRSGRVLGKTDYAEYTKRYGTPSITVHRVDLHRALAAALPPERVRLGAPVTGFAADGARVVARLAGGREEEGDLLVGADGIGSAVRAQIHGASPPRYAGYTCWRALVPFEHPDLPEGYAFESWGRGARFAILPCGPGRLFFYATRNAPADAPDGPGGRKGDLEATFRGWFDPVPAVIAATPPEAILRNDIVDRDPLSTWGAGRVTLLGDAAHATTPNFGQGACMAMEDALVLARSLRDVSDVETALRAYESDRIARTARIVLESRRLGWAAQWSNPILAWLRDTIARSGLTERPTLERFEAMLSFEPPPL